ncbi:MAG TPA: hypothetical protein VE713_12530 [Pyrinomonadaceae bacterium]|jgi:hypothetical protein|nr:hypothetical protein [Pyrinomonadaceae bacterium]
MKKLAIALIFTLLLGIAPVFASSAQNTNTAPTNTGSMGRHGRRHHRRHHRRARRHHRRHHRRAARGGNTNS